MVLRRPRPEALGDAGDIEVNLTRDARAGQLPPRAADQSPNLDDDRRGALGMLGGPGVERAQRRHELGIGDQREARRLWLGRERHAAVKLQPLDDLGPHGRAVEPERRVEIEQGQAHRGGGRMKRDGRLDRGRHVDDPTGPRDGLEDAPEDPLAVERRVGEPGQHRQSSPRTKVKNSTRDGATRSAAARRRAVGPRRAARRPSARDLRGAPDPAVMRRAPPPARRGADPARGRTPRPTAPPSSSTAQRVTVISPTLKRAPVPPARPRTITRPVSGGRSMRCGGGAATSRQRPSSSSGEA